MLASAQFPYALVEHPERPRQERPQLLKLRIQSDTINAAATFAIPNMLNPGNHPLDE